MYFIQHCFICRPSDFTVSEDARIEPGTVATFAMADTLVTRLDLISQTWLDLIHQTRLDHTHQTQLLVDLIYQTRL
jgi:hypothetical protein